MSYVLSHVMSQEKSHVMSQDKSHVKSHSRECHSGLIIILYCSLVRRIYGHVLCLYKVLSFAALSLFPFLSSADLLSSTIRNNYNKFYIHQPILSILTFSKKPHRKLTGEPSPKLSSCLLECPLRILYWPHSVLRSRPSLTTASFGTLLP